MAHKLAKKLAFVKPGTLFAGIDMALERNMAVLITERAEVRTQFHFPNDRPTIFGSSWRPNWSARACPTAW
jgi:hypothetical protein